MFHYKEHGLENLLPQEIMSKGHTPLEDTDHNTIIYGRVFETADVLTDFQECQPYAMTPGITGRDLQERDLFDDLILAYLSYKRKCYNI